MAREIGVGKRSALVGAALVVANPVTWFDSVLWGQVDSFGVVFLLLGLRSLWRDQPERAAIWTVIAALIKPQLAILAPLVAVVTIRRALWPPKPVSRSHPGRPARRRPSATRTSTSPRTAAGSARSAAGSAGPITRSGSSRRRSPAS